MTESPQHAAWCNRPAHEKHLSFAEWIRNAPGRSAGSPVAPDSLRSPSNAPCTATLTAGRLPKELSTGEEAFADHCRIYGLAPEREYKFAPGRKWAFDFAWPDSKLAVEIEGGTRFGKSRHSRGDGFERDARKYNAAALLGWRILRFTTAMVISGEAIDVVRGWAK